MSNQSNALPAPGTYPGCRKNGMMRVDETDKGAITVHIPVILPETSPVRWNGKHTMTLVKQDETLQTRRIDELKSIFGWDGLSFFALEELDPNNEAEFELVIEHKLWTPATTETDPNPEERTIVDVKWMNPPGGSTRMPEPLNDVDRKRLASKFANKLKAHSGGKPASKPAATAKPASVAAKPAAQTKGAVLPARGASALPSRSNATTAMARTSSQEEIWQALTESRGVGDDADAAKALGQEFYDKQDELYPGKGGALSPSEWGAVADAMGV